MYSGLNREQHNAVVHFGPPLLILAGAGSGKTRVITTKISHLIDHHNIRPGTIVAVTFTNKAAAEMRGRAEQLNSAAVGATICTFHSFGARFLRRHASAAGLAANFTIYDDRDSLLLLKSLFPNDTEARLKQVMHAIQGAKHYGLSADDDINALEGSEDIAAYYRAYQRKLNEIGNVDFGDLILKPVHILKHNATIRAAEQEAINVLLVDEYQDTNHAQYMLVQQLYHRGMYLCVVGDDDQSIYAFRGSDVTHIVNFPHYFPNTESMYLLQNYRSTQHILTLASHMIAHNNTRYKKVLYTEYRGGQKPALVHLHDDYQEAAYVAADIIAQNRDGETAIVYRTNAQSRIFESEFNRNGIAHRVVGGVRFYEREEIKDVLAYLKLIANPHDEVALRRIINKPARGIGPATVQKILTAATDHGGDVIAVLEHPPRTGNNTVADGCNKTAAVVRDGRRMIVTDDSETLSELSSIANVLQHIVDVSGLGEYYRDVDRQATTFKSDNIIELIASATYYPATQSGLVEFLEQAELKSERYAAGSDDARVTLITMHNTKGLEFDTVYIVGLQDGLFPRTTDLDAQKMEEERRLFYVAITRAKRRLTLTTFEFRHQYGKIIPRSPSRFLAEIDADLVERQILTERHGATERYPTRNVRYRDRAATSIRNQALRADGDAGINADVYPAAEEKPRFAVGAAVFHNDYGTGEVRSRRRDGAQYVLGVQFESGKMAHFIEKYAALEKIAID